MSLHHPVKTGASEPARWRWRTQKCRHARVAGWGLRRCQEEKTACNAKPGHGMNSGKTSLVTLFHDYAAGALRRSKHARTVSRSVQTCTGASRISSMAPISTSPSSL